MAELPLMPLWTDAYLGDTTHLSTVEHGAYLLLLMTMWRNGGWLPDDDNMLARYTRLTAHRWRKMAPTIRAFFDAEDGRLSQKRLASEYENAIRLRQSRSVSAQARWLKNNNADHASACASECKPSPSPKEEKKDEAIASSKEKNATRLSDDWSPSFDSHELGASLKLTAAEVDDQCARFRDYWRAQGGAKGRKLDWDATWRNWLRRAADDRRKRNGNGRQSHGDTMRDAFAELRERVGGHADGGAGSRSYGGPPPDEPGDLDFAGLGEGGYLRH